MAPHLRWVLEFLFRFFEDMVDQGDQSDLIPPVEQSEEVEEQG
jgi:hypothetical protein